MELSVNKYEFVKTLQENVKIQIPEEAFAFQEFNHRSLYLVIPQWTTWQMRNDNKPEEIWKLNIIYLDASGQGIQTTSLTVDKRTIEQLLTYRTAKEKNSEDSLRLKILDAIMNSESLDRISPATFEQYYTTLLNELTLFKTIK